MDMILFRWPRGLHPMTKLSPDNVDGWMDYIPPRPDFDFVCDPLHLVEILGVMCVKVDASS